MARSLRGRGSNLQVAVGGTDSIETQNTQRSKHLSTSVPRRERIATVDDDSGVCMNEGALDVLGMQPDCLPCNPATVPYSAIDESLRGGEGTGHERGCGTHLLAGGTCLWTLPFQRHPSLAIPIPRQQAHDSLTLPSLRPTPSSFLVAWATVAARLMVMCYLCVA